MEPEETAEGGGGGCSPSPGRQDPQRLEHGSDSSAEPPGGTNPAQTLIVEF